MLGMRFPFYEYGNSYRFSGFWFIEAGWLIFWSHLVHCNDVRMRAMASQITGVSIVCSTPCAGANQMKHQSTSSLAFVRGIHRWPETRKMFPFDDVRNHVINVHDQKGWQTNNMSIGDMDGTSFIHSRTWLHGGENPCTISINDMI